MSLNHPNSLKYLKKIAIKQAMNEDKDIHLFVDKCYRYFSKTYSTPLKESYDLLPEEVVLIYYKDQLSQLKIEELQELLDKTKEYMPVFATDKEVEEEDLDEESWIAQEEAKLKEDELKEKNKDIIAQTHEAIEKLTERLRSNVKAIPKELDDFDLEFEE